MLTVTVRSRFTICWPRVVLRMLVAGAGVADLLFTPSSRHNAWTAVDQVRPSRLSRQAIHIRGAELTAACEMAGVANRTAVCTALVGVTLIAEESCELGRRRGWALNYDAPNAGYRGQAEDCVLGTRQDLVLLDRLWPSMSRPPMVTPCVARHSLPRSSDLPAAVAREGGE